MMYDYLWDKFDLNKYEIEFIPIRTNSYKEAKELVMFLMSCGYCLRGSIDSFINNLCDDHIYDDDFWYITLKFNTSYLYYTVDIDDDTLGVPHNLPDHYVIDIKDLNKDYVKIDI